MSKWINVEDRLPKKSSHNHWSRSVLGFCNVNKCQYTVVYNHELKVFEHFGNSSMVHGGVTHWQPLPEPPEQE